MLAKPTEYLAACGTVPITIIERDSLGPRSERYMKRSAGMIGEL
jgi:hypothetical protein